MSVEARADGPDPLHPPGRAGDLAAELVTYDPALTKLADLVAIADRRSERTRAQGLLRAGGSVTHDDGAHDIARNHDYDRCVRPGSGCSTPYCTVCPYRGKPVGR